MFPLLAIVSVVKLAADGNPVSGAAVNPHRYPHWMLVGVWLFWGKSGEVVSSGLLSVELGLYGAGDPAEVRVLGGGGTRDLEGMVVVVRSADSVCAPSPWRHVVPGSLFTVQLCLDVRM
jgi:hypothetical protein